MKRQQSSIPPDSAITTSPQTKFPVFALIATILAHFEQHVMSFALAPLLVLVQADLSLTFTQLGIVGASPLVTIVIFQLFSGYFADNYGSRGLIIGGTGLSAIAMFLVSTSTGYLSLVFYQLLLGIGLSTYHPSGIRLITKIFPEEHKGKAISFQGTGGITGSAVIPVVAVFLAQQFNGWRQALRIIAWIGVAATIIELLLLLSFSEKNIPQKQASVEKFAPSGGNLDLKAVFLSLGFGFILLYSLGREAVFRNISYFVPLFYESIGYSVYEAGFVTTLLLGVGAIAQIIGGFFADIISSTRRNIFLVVTNGLASVFLLILAYIVRGTWLLFVTVLIGFTYFVSFPFFMLIVSNYAPADAQGFAFALLFSSMTLFAALSSVMFGVIGDAFGLRQAMVFVAISSAFAALAAFLLPHAPGQNAGPSEQ